jgi:transposase-like protein
MARPLELPRRQGLQPHTVGLHIWRLIRTTNSLERLNREICCRTRVVSIFPNENACLRLVSAILIVFRGSWSYIKH